MVDAGDVGQVLGTPYVNHLAVGLEDVVVHRGRRRDEVEVELALEALLDDLHVKQPQETDAEAKAKGHGGLGRPGERRVVHVELVEGVAEVLVLLGVHGEETGVDHRLGLAISRAGRGAGADGVGDGVAHAHALRILEAGDHIAHLAHGQLVDRCLGRALHAHAVAEEVLVLLHHVQLVVLADVAVKDAHRGHHTAILVKVRVEDEGLERGVSVSRGRGDEEHDGLEQVVDAFAGLTGDAHGVVGGDGKVLLDLGLDLVGMGARQVDLVDGRHDVELGVHGEVGVGDGLRLDALRGVDHEHRALARRERAGDLVGEVDVTRRVDEVELVGLPVVGVVHDAHGIGLDGNATLALDVHGVQQLGLHVALVHRARELENAIGDGGLPVVDVGDDREVPDVGDVCGIHGVDSSVWGPHFVVLRVNLVVGPQTICYTRGVDLPVSRSRGLTNRKS